jgi:hypothetical protein
MRLVTPALTCLLLLAAGCTSSPSGGTPGSAPVPFGYGVTAQNAQEASNVGRIRIGQWPNLTIDGKPMQAAPGARIFADGNRMTTANPVPQGARVQYELDGLGQVRTIRVLPAQ